MNKKNCFLFICGWIFAIGFAFCRLAHCSTPPADEIGDWVLENSSYTITGTTVTLHGNVYLKTASTITITGIGNLAIGQFWLKTIPITINNPTNYGLVNYQVWIPTTAFTLTQWSDIKGGTGQADLDDVRFVSSITAGGYWKSCSYWIEGGTLTPRGFWVKNSSAPVGDSTIHMYYGNSFATATSSAPLTFIREIDGTKPLRASWHLDEGSGATTADTSGVGNNGTLVNGPTWVTGKYGNALVFNGSNQYVNCGNTSNFNITTEFTIEFWAKHAVVANVDNKPFWAHRVGGSGIECQFQVRFGQDGGGKKLAYWAHTAALGWGGAESNSNVIVDTNWHHYAITKLTGTNAVTMYLDGNIIPNTINTSYGTLPTVLEAEDQKYIGCRNLAEFFNGTLDEMRIYNRALTSAEITDIYGNGSNRHGYTTTAYLGRVLVRQYVLPGPTTSVGTTQDSASTGYYIYTYPQGQMYIESGSGINK